MRFFCCTALVTILGTFNAGSAERPIIVSQDGRGDFQGADEKPIQAAIEKAIKQGGGDILIRPGTYDISRGIFIKDGQHIALRGADRESVILKLPPLAFAESKTAASAGSTEISVGRMQNITVGMRLRIEADGEVEAFTKKPKPYLLAVVKTVEAGKITLTEALKFPVPAGTLIRHEDAPNLIEMRGKCEDVLIGKLTLDGGRAAADPAVRGHAQLCGLMAAGAYDYEKGRTGPPVKQIAVQDCIIQNTFGRGVAFYSVEEAAVERCAITNTADEAIDLDHFTAKCLVRGNRISLCRVGVELNDANDCMVLGNEFSGCVIGINLWRWCKQDDLNKRNFIRDNLFSATEQNAIQLATGTSDNSIEDNEIAGAGRNGISVSGSSQILRNNAIRGAKLKPIAITEGEHKIEANKTE